MIQQIFPYIEFMEKGENKSENNEYYDVFYILCSMLYPNNIPKRESVKEWISMLWDEFKIKGNNAINNVNKYGILDITHLC